LAVPFCCRAHPPSSAFVLCPLAVSKAFSSHSRWSFSPSARVCLGSRLCLSNFVSRSFRLLLVVFCDLLRFYFFLNKSTIHCPPDLPYLPQAFFQPSILFLADRKFESVWAPPPIDDFMQSPLPPHLRKFLYLMLIEFFYRFGIVILSLPYEQFIVFCGPYSKLISFRHSKIHTV